MYDFNLFIFNGCLAFYFVRNYFKFPTILPQTSNGHFYTENCTHLFQATCKGSLTKNKKIGNFAQIAYDSKGVGINRVFLPSPKFLKHYGFILRCFQVYSFTIPSKQKDQ